MIGRTIGPYRIVSKLGEGGMGEVYRASDTRLQRDVAIKILPLDVADDHQRLVRFEREARAASALDHPGICPVYDLGDDHGRPFIVMPLLEGDTLAAVLNRYAAQGASLPVHETLAIGRQIADALDAAHSRGVVHRDIKPANIFITTRGEAKLLDFGLAKPESEQRRGERGPRQDASQAETVPESLVTQPGTAMGTPAYMSPEQARGESLDARTDLFSLGSVLYELLTGRQAFGGPTTAVVFSAVLEKTPEPISRTNPEVPAQLQAIVSRALEKNRDLRYQSAADIRADLDRVRRDLATGAEETAGVPRRRPRRRTFALVALAGLVLSSVSFIWPRLGADDAAIDSVAVLPFVTMSDSPDAEYLGDGLTDTLINSLSQVRSLRVVPRSVVFRYKGKALDLDRIGGQLGVRAVLSGRVIQRGDTLVIGAELVDVTRQAQLWGAQYNRRLADMQVIEAEIAREISTNLRLRLSGDERQRLARAHTQNTDSYHLYLKGLYHRQKTTEAGFRQSVRYFEQAIDLDPAYALAYSGLSDSYGSLAYLELARPSDVWPRAKTAAETALRLDNTLAEAHTALGHALLRWDHDLDGARRAFDRALALDPTYAVVHHWYSHYWTTLGEWEQSVAASRRTVEQQPLDLMLNAHLLFYLSAPEREAELQEQIRRVREIEPGFWAAHTMLGRLYLRRGMADEGIAALTQGVEASGRMPLALLFLGSAFAQAGRRQEAEAVIDELARRPYVPAIYIARIYAALDNREPALAMLARALEERSSQWSDSMRGWPASWRSDPRFDDLLRRVGLPY